eukprot:4309817-Prymnesium_polylepis.1
MAPAGSGRIVEALGINSGRAKYTHRQRARGAPPLPRRSLTLHDGPPRTGAAPAQSVKECVASLCRSRVPHACHPCVRVPRPRSPLRHTHASKPLSHR